MSESPPAIPDHTLLRLIGRGSYGEVWLARNVMGTPRAVKIVRRSSFDTDRPYEREFEGIRKCEPVSRACDGLVDVLQMGRDDAAGFFYYVMELADAAGEAGDTGTQLSESVIPVPAGAAYRPLTLSLRLREGALSAEECLSLAQSLCGALAHLHGHGLIHRDVKPSNILYAGGIPKLGDIGLVAEAGASRSFVGTEGYVPQEGPGSVKADLFALGKVLYEALTGLDRTMFPELPDNWAQSYEFEQRLELNEIVLRACEDDPERRYMNAKDFLADVAVVASGRSIQKLRAQEKRLRAARTAGFIAAAAALAATAGFIVASGQAAREKSLRERAEQAEEIATDARWAALCANVRAARRDISAGAVTAALSAARQAGSIRGSADLRSDTAFLLGRPDLTPHPVPALADQVFEQYVLLDIERRRWLHIPSGINTPRGESRGIPEWRFLDGAPPLPGTPMFGSSHGWNLAFSPDCRWISDHQGTTHIWDLDSFEKTGELPEEKVGVEAKFTTQGEIIRSRAPDEIVWFDAATGAEKRHVTVPGWAASYVAPSEDGRSIVLFSAGKGLICANGADGSLRWTLNMPLAMWPPVWSADGSRFFLRMGSQPGFIDVTTGVFHAFSDGLRTRGGDEYCFTGSRHLLAGTNWGNVTWITDVTRDMPVLRLADGGRTPVFSASQRLFGLHEWSLYGARLYDWHPRTGLHILGSTGIPANIAFTPDEKRLASCEVDACRWWSLDPVDDAAPAEEKNIPDVYALLFYPGTGQAALLGKQATPHPPSPGLPPSNPLPAGSIIARASQSADGSVRAYIGSGEYAIQRDGVSLPPFPINVTMETLIVSSDGRRTACNCFAPGSQIPFVMLWDIATAGHAPILVHRFEFPARRVALSPDGRWLSCAGARENAVFDLTDFTESARWPRRSAGASGETAFSPDGAYLLHQTSLEDFTIRRTGTWERVLSLNSPLEEALILPAFSPRGRWLAGVGTRGEIYVWDIHTLTAKLNEMGLGWE